MGLSRVMEHRQLLVAVPKSISLMTLSELMTKLSEFRIAAPEVNFMEVLLYAITNLAKDALNFRATHFDTFCPT